MTKSIFIIKNLKKNGGFKVVGRNELCPCGSGRKYKKCCLEKDKAKDIARNRIKLGEKQFDNVITKISESTSEDYKVYKNKCEVDFGVSSYELENLMNVYYLVNYKYNKQSSLMMNYFNKHKQIKLIYECISS